MQPYGTLQSSGKFFLIFWAWTIYLLYKLSVQYLRCPNFQAIMAYSIASGGAVAMSLKSLLYQGHSYMKKPGS